MSYISNKNIWQEINITSDKSTWRSSSQVKVLWYRTSTQSFDKRHQNSDLKMLVTIVFVCKPIRTIFSIWVQSIYNFHFPFQRKNRVFCGMRDRLWFVAYNACWTNQLEVQLLVATFVKGLHISAIYYQIIMSTCKKKVIRTSSLISSYYSVLLPIT